MSYSTRVYLHGYCSSFIIILLISSLSYAWLSSQLSLSHFIIALSFSHLNSAKPISFSFFFKISGFEDEDDDSSAEISRATDWVWSTSLGGEWVGNADQPLRSNNPFGNGEGDGELIGHGGRVGQSCCDCDCVVLLWLLLWKISESVAGFCWRVASWVWVWMEKTMWWVCAREEREGNNKKCKKKEYFIK